MMPEPVSASRDNLPLRSDVAFVPSRYTLLLCIQGRSLEPKSRSFRLVRPDMAKRCAEGVAAAPRLAGKLA